MRGAGYAAGAGALAVAFLTLGVESGSLTVADRRIELAIHTYASDNLIGAMTALSFIGSTVSLAVLALVCAAYCVARRTPRAAGFVVASPLGASLIDTGFKLLVHRPRPHLWAHAAVLGSFSFPSGHATGSAAFFSGTTLAAWRLFGTRAGWVVGVPAVTLVIGIGFSRVYLGVHWPSDVIAGYALGLTWVFLLFLSGPRGLQPEIVSPGVPASDPEPRPGIEVL